VTEAGDTAPQTKVVRDEKAPSFMKGNRLPAKESIEGAFGQSVGSTGERARLVPPVAGIRNNTAQIIRVI